MKITHNTDANLMQYIDLYLIDRSREKEYIYMIKQLRCRVLRAESHILMLQIILLQIL